MSEKNKENSILKPVKKKGNSENRTLKKVTPEKGKRTPPGGKK